MSRSLSVAEPLGAPFAWIGRGAIALLSYLGGLAVLVGRGSSRLPGRTGWRALSRELSWMFGMGLPLAGLVHVGLGSFLAMQAYYGGTFVEGTGAVVGVGLFRNIAPLMAGLTMAGLLGARITPELRARRFRNEPEGRARRGFLERTAEGEPERASAPGVVEEESPDRLVGVRLVAAMVTGPVAGLVGATVGTVVGWRVAAGLMGVSSHSFFQMFWDMLWFRDVIGLMAKGALFGLVAAAFACHEGLRGQEGDGPDAVPNATFRAVLCAGLVILMFNSAWFVLAYHAGPALGPTLLKPPSV